MEKDGIPWMIIQIGKSTQRAAIEVVVVVVV